MEQIRKSGKRKIYIFILLAIFLLSIYLLSSFLDFEDIINRIGPGNGYIIVFVASFFAGFSALTIFSFYSLLITFISGGLNPVLLALVAGTSLSLGDMFMYYFGRNGRDLISGKLDKQINRMSQFFRHRNREKYIPVISWFYLSFIPLPNDWILLFLASIRYPSKKMNLIIIFGDYTHVCVLTILTVKGIMLFA